MEPTRAYLTANYASARVRSVQRDGREWLVAPMTLIVPGVLNGSKGPLLYTLGEIKKNHDSWNHIPIVVNHPYVDGVPVSARDPDILEKFGVGHVFNALVRGKLVAEGWFDVAKLAKVEPDVLNSLRANRKIELSTGLFTTNVPAPKGVTFNGRGYSYIAKDFRPDHLAILTHERGACSLDDGCGVLVNSQSCSCGGTCSPCQEKHGMKLTPEQRKAAVDKIVANHGAFEDADRDFLNDMADDKLSKLVANCDMPAKGAAKAPAAPVEEEEEEEEEEAVVPGKKPPVANKGTELTAAEWYAQAPAEVKEAVKGALAVNAERKQELVERIVANAAADKRDALAKRLSAKSLDELRDIAELVPTANAAADEDDNPFVQRRANYAGAAGGPVANRGGKSASNVTLNADDRKDVLAPPTFNWEEEAKVLRSAGK